MQREIWVKLGASENEIQFNSLDRAMEKATPGTVIRLMPGRVTLNVTLKPGVVIKGLGNGCMIVDPKGQLETNPPVQFLTIIRPNGVERHIRPTSNPEVEDIVDKIAREQEQIRKIQAIMGVNEKYPSWVCDYKFKFGKHKGKNAAYVIDKDASYLKWLYESDFKIDLRLQEIITQYASEIGI